MKQMKQIKNYTQFINESKDYDILKLYKLFLQYPYIKNFIAENNLKFNYAQNNIEFILTGQFNELSLKEKAVLNHIWNVILSNAENEVSSEIDFSSMTIEFNDNSIKFKCSFIVNKFDKFFMLVNKFWIWDINIKPENAFKTTLSAIIYAFYKHSHYETKFHYENTYMPFYKLSKTEQELYENTYEYMLKNDILFRLFSSEINLLSYFADLSGNDKSKKLEFLDFCFENNTKIYITKK